MSPTLLPWADGEETKLPVNLLEHFQLGRKCSMPVMTSCHYLVDSFARLQQCDEVSWRGSMHKLRLVDRREELREVILRAMLTRRSAAAGPRRACSFRSNRPAT